MPWIGISRSKYHDWIQRFGKVNEHNAWVPRDHWLTDDEIARICQFARQNPAEGYRRMTFMMLDADVVACSPASVYRVLKKAGLLAGCTPNVTKKGTGYVQPLIPHQEWHVDISYLNIAGTFYFLCSILDGYSRFIVHWEIRAKMEEIDVETILQRAREKFPDTTPRIISDNGPQFIAKDFKEFIRIAGMPHVRTSPYYPQSNGKLERFHKTIKGECIRVQVPLSLEDARRIVADYVEYSNTVRLHSKLAEARDRRKVLRQTRHEREEARSVVSRPAIDFAAVRAALTIVQVLTLLGFQRRSDRVGQQRGPCPLHGSTQGTACCFSVNTHAQTFHCFQCGRGGNALDLWAQATKQTPYDAAVDLCQRLNIPLPLLPPPTPRPGNREEEPVAPGVPTCTMASP
jgi:putative transposase